MTGIPKALYGVATEYWLLSTSYNPHYRIYKSKKIAEKNVKNIKEKYLRYGMIGIANTIKVVEYKLVEDEDNNGRD